jgi:hypothetical protein
LEIDMKRILAVAVLALASIPAMAQHWHGHGFRHHGYHHNVDNWVAPLIIGGVIGAVIANNRDPVVVQQPPVVVVQQPSIYTQRQIFCTAWKEIQNPDGVIYRERSCTQ